MELGIDKQLRQEKRNSTKDWEHILLDLIEYRWLTKLLPIFRKNEDIFNHLSERKKKIKIVPEQKDMFNAFKYTPFDNVRVCILGMAPYFQLINGKPEAHGLAFSYRKTEEIDFHVPKSLAVIRNEIETDVYDGEVIGFDPNLERWAKQGVFLLNTALTTEVGDKEAHMKLWEPFTAEVLKILNEQSAGIIFCLWGSYAKKYKHMINESHYILEADHPAVELYPGSAGKFYGCRHFSQINEILMKNNKEKIEW